jgi:hypothetical protein
VVHRPSGLVVVPSRWTDRLPTSKTKNTEIRLSVTAQSTWKKSQASIVEAWVRRNWRQVRVGVPDRRRRYPQPPQDAADRGRSHAVPELEQLAVDSLVSPAVILSGQALDQRGHRVINGRTPNAMGIGPLLGDQATMPAQDRARRNQAMPPQPLRQPADEGGEDRAIRPIQARLRIGSAQHGNFVAQHQQLDVLSPEYSPRS